MVAKPEYSSPPDEVCCWQGRRGTAASRSAAAELLAGSAMAKRMAALWQRAIGKILLAGAPWRRCCWQGTVAGLLAGAPWQSCWPGAPWKRVGSGYGNKLRQGKQSAGRDAPSGRRCRQGCCSEEPSGSRQGNSPSCRQGKSTPCCKRTKKRAAKTTLS